MRFLLLALLVAPLSLCSCTSSDFYGDEDLGGGYHTWRDGRYTSIVYSPDPNYSGDAAVIAIRGNVVRYSTTDSLLAAVTVPDPSGPDADPSRSHNFYLIDKADDDILEDCGVQGSCTEALRSVVVGPLDSTQFFQELKAHIGDSDPVNVLEWQGL